MALVVALAALVEQVGGELVVVVVVAFGDSNLDARVSAIMKPQMAATAPPRQMLLRVISALTSVDAVFSAVYEQETKWLGGHVLWRWTWLDRWRNARGLDSLGRLASCRNLLHSFEPTIRPVEHAGSAWRR